MQWIYDQRRGLFLNKMNDHNLNFIWNQILISSPPWLDLKYTLYDLQRETAIESPVYLFSVSSEELDVFASKEGKNMSYNNI